MGILLDVSYCENGFVAVVHMCVWYMCMYRWTCDVEAGD